VCRPGAQLRRARAVCSVCPAAGPGPANHRYGVAVGDAGLASTPDDREPGRRRLAIVRVTPIRAPGRMALGGGRCEGGRVGAEGADE
jgi:hypothetical protein